ncbi:MAG: AI-2E family transporter [Phycisphaerales bacterium]
MPSNASPPPAPLPPSSWARLHLWEIQFVRDGLVVAAAIGIVWMGYAMRSVTTPLLVALGLAYLFEPVVAWATVRWRLSRATVVIALLCALGGGVLLSLSLITPLAIRQTVSLVGDVRNGKLTRALERVERQVPEAMRQPLHGFLESIGLVGVKGLEQIDPAALPTVEQVPPKTSAAPATTTEPESAPRTGTKTAEEPATESTAGAPHAGERISLGAGASDSPIATALRAELEEERIRRIVREEMDRASAPASPSSFNATRILGLIRSGLDTAGSVLSALVGIGLLAFLIPFYFFFFSVSYPTVMGFFDSLIPSRGRDRTLDLLRQMDGAVAGFVRGRLVISAVVTTMLALGWLVCGVPYSIVLAVVVGIFNLVPYLAGIGWPIAVGLLAVEQMGLPPDQRMSWFWIVAGPSIVFIVAQAFDGYVLTPLIAGKATDLDPVTILVAVLAGGAVAGIYGMLLAIPVVACGKILIREVLLPRVKRWLEGRASDPLPM